MSVTLGPKLQLLINANQADNYTDQFREFLRFFDAMILGSVLNSTTTAPPSSPNNGDAYLLIGSPLTGAWAGQSGTVAVWSTEITTAGTNTKVPGWEFWTPNQGWMVWDQGAGGMWYFSQGGWTRGGTSPLVTVASAPSTAFDFSEGLRQTTTLTADTTLTFSNAQAGDRVSVILVQDTAGSHNVTFPANALGVSSASWAGGTRGLYSFIFDGNNYLADGTPVVGM